MANATIKLNFTRRAGKYDDLTIVRSDTSQIVIRCPKQGMIPHDMVHFAVESIVRETGLLRRIAAGEDAIFAMSAQNASDAIERLVEVVQAEVWSGPVPANELIDLYTLGCASRGHPALPIQAEQIDQIRLAVSELDTRWRAVPVNGTLALELTDGAGMPVDA